MQPLHVLSSSLLVRCDDERRWGRRGIRRVAPAVRSEAKSGMWWSIPFSLEEVMGQYFFFFLFFRAED